MGWNFPLESANIVGYLTTPGPSRPPRLTRTDLYNFLGSLQHDSLPRLISSDPD